MTQVRGAQASDNSDLLSLFGRCPMEADISLVVERDPDFFALGRARGEALTFVAEWEGRLVGAISTWRHRAWIRGREGSIRFVGDLRVDPSARRRGVARGLALAIIEHLKTLPAAPFLAATGEGNSAVAPLVSAFGAAGPPLARFSSWQLLPIARLRIPASLDIGAAESRDEDELVDLLDGFHRQRDFAPVFSDGGFRTILSSSGMQLSDYLVARRNGRIVAAMGAWDASSIRRTRVAGMPAWMRGLSAAARGLAHIAPVSPLPRVGAHLQFRYVRHPSHAAGEEEALMALVRSAIHAAGDRRDHFLLFTCADDDPLARVVSRLPKLRFRYRLTSFLDDRSGASLFPDDAGVRQPAFDDAALA